MKNLFTIILFVCLALPGFAQNGLSGYSVIIRPDSLVIYYGNFTNKTKSRTLPFEKEAVEKWITPVRKTQGDKLQVIIKPGLFIGATNRVLDFGSWLLDWGIVNLESDSLSELERKTYGLRNYPEMKVDSRELLSGTDSLGDISFQEDVIIILLDNNRVFYYTDSLPGGKYAAMTGEKSISGILSEIQKKNPSAPIRIGIKPSTNMDIRHSSDMADEMMLLGITSYRLLNLLPGEMALLGVQPFDFNPPVVKVETPATVKIDQPFTDTVFLIKIKADGTVYYKEDADPMTKSFTSLARHDSLGLSRAISEYKNRRQTAGKTEQIVIQGDPEVKYPDFESVINALKKNEIYKYSLVSIKED